MIYNFGVKIRTNSETFRVDNERQKGEFRRDL